MHQQLQSRVVRLLHSSPDLSREERSDYFCDFCRTSSPKGGPRCIHQSIRSQERSTNCLVCVSYQRRHYASRTYAFHPVSAVQVYYNIPSSNHTFVTTLDTPQAVFVHPAISNDGLDNSRSRRSQSTASNRDNRRDSTTSRKRRKLDRNGSSYTHTPHGSDSAEEDGHGVDVADGDDSEDDEQDKWLVLGSTSLKAVLGAVCKAR